MVATDEDEADEVLAFAEFVAVWEPGWSAPAPASDPTEPIPLTASRYLGCSSWAEEPTPARLTADQVDYIGDPDRMLKRIRQGLEDLADAAQRARSATTPAEDEDAAARHRIATALLTSSVAALDAYLTGGGQLPASWARGARGQTAAQDADAQHSSRTSTSATASREPRRDGVGPQHSRAAAER